MSAPPKPWERAGANNHSMIDIPSERNVTESNRLQSSQIPMAPPVMPTGAPMMPNGAPVNVRRIYTVPAPPPRPHRPLMRQSYVPSVGYNNPYSSYGSYGGYSGLGYYGNNYGGYGSFGGYGMNRFGQNVSGNDPENRFIQLAEESSRPAFQSIESIVQAFGSISFMLESTFNAVYSSFRAVLSVAENFGRLRTTFGQFFSTFAIFRMLRWLYKKLLYLMGLRKMNPAREEIWQQAMSGATALPPGTDTKEVRSSWPVLMFMGIMFSGPYLAWKLINSLSNVNTPNAYDPKDWKKSKDPAYTAVALYDFVAESNQEVSFRAGHKLLVAPKELQPRGIKGWMLATVDGKRVGLVPYNYLKFAAVNIAAPQPQTVQGVPPSTLPENQEPPVKKNMTAFDQHIPTINEQAPGVPVPMMQTGWVPQPVGPPEQEMSNWIPKTDNQNSIKSDIPNPQLPP